MSSEGEEEWRDATRRGDGADNGRCRQRLELPTDDSLRVLTNLSTQSGVGRRFCDFAAPPLWSEAHLAVESFHDPRRFPASSGGEVLDVVGALEEPLWPFYGSVVDMG